MVGRDTMSDTDGWIAVGALGLDKLVSKPDPPMQPLGSWPRNFSPAFPLTNFQLGTCMSRSSAIC